VKLRKFNMADVAYCEPP